MQINFWMGDKDRELFHDYIFSRGGYLIPRYLKTTEVPIAWQENKVDFNELFLHIYKEDNFSKSHFSDPDWVTYLPAFKSYFVHGPGMEYKRPYNHNDGTLIQGRIYMGLLGAFSYLKPGVSDPSCYERFAAEYKQMENFYQSCCRFIRKHFRNVHGFYHGPQSDQLEKEGMEKLSFPRV
jgi:hypothetical protein